MAIGKLSIKAAAEQKSRSIDQATELALEIHNPVQVFGRGCRSVSIVVLLVDDEIIFNVRVIGIAGHLTIMHMPRLAYIYGPILGG